MSKYQTEGIRIKYKVNPSSAEFDDVAQALITKYPCLKEQGSVSGYYGWKMSLKVRNGQLLH